jgi:hypothetical protein
MKETVKNLLEVTSVALDMAFNASDESVERQEIYSAKGTISRLLIKAKSRILIVKGITDTVTALRYLTQEQQIQVKEESHELVVIGDSIYLQKTGLC